MKLHKFLNDWHEGGAVKYAAGSHYEPNDETRLACAGVHALEVDVPASAKAAPFNAPPPPDTPRPKKSDEKSAEK